MPTWELCFDSVVIGRVNSRWSRTAPSWDQDLALDARQTITGPSSPGAALVYSYAYLNHHVGAISESVKLIPNEQLDQDECVLVDYGCGPGTALMALAENHLLRTGRPLTVHYRGVETRQSPTLALAAELFRCIQAQGLISSASTMGFSEFAAPIDFPAVQVGSPIYFSMCYVLAHPFYDLKANVQQDPVRHPFNAIMGCRNHYARPIGLIYTNATFHPDRPVHAAWRRLLKLFDHDPNVRNQEYRYKVYDSRRINGTGSIQDWQQKRYSTPSTTSTTRGACDFRAVG